MPTNYSTPYLKRKTKKVYRRKGRKGKTKSKALTINSRTILIPKPVIGGFPHSVFTTLKYVQSGTLNPGVGGTNAVQVFRCNGMYDPDYTGAGHQPRGFDEWMAIYDHYYVKRAKIVVEFHNGDGSLEVMCGVAVRDDFPTETDPNDYHEQDSHGRMLGRVGSSHNHTIMTRYYNFSKQNYTKYTDDENKGTATANPTEMGYFHLWCGQPWGGDSSNTYYTATIYYSALFTELKDMTQS